uniref:DUF641 domain-containing protein n=1 Tax=Oryza brachyantha TaxID=4533 RepID=J3ME29_ORYBR
MEPRLANPAQPHPSASLARPFRLHRASAPLQLLRCLPLNPLLPQQSSHQVRPSSSSTPSMQITWLKEGRTDRIMLDATKDQRDIVRLEDFISRSVQIMKAIDDRSAAKFDALRSLGPQLENLAAITCDCDEVIERAKAMKIAALRVEQVSYLERIEDQATALEKTKKAHTGLQAKCTRLLSDKAKIEAESSRLIASNSVLKFESNKLKKLKDTTTAELVAKPSWYRSFISSSHPPLTTLGVPAEVPTRAQVAVEAVEARAKVAEHVLDQLIMATQAILGSMESLAQPTLTTSYAGSRRCLLTTGQMSGRRPRSE